MDTRNDLPQNQHKWEREEQVLLVVEYYSSKGDSKLMDKSCSLISEVLRRRGLSLGVEVSEKYRNVNGIKRQMDNLKHFDSDSNANLSGHESIWMRNIIEEYKTNPLGLTIEAYNTIKKYMFNF